MFQTKVFTNWFFENRAFYEITLKNVFEPSRSQMTNMAHAHYMLIN